LKDVDHIRSVLRQVKDYGAKRFFCQAFGGIQDVGCRADMINSRQRIGKVSDLIFLSSDGYYLIYFIS
jgi:hypothetical protein